MNDLPLLLRYAVRLLLIVGPVEFLLGRTLSRIGGMLDPGPVADAVNGLGLLGLKMIEPVHVLALVILVLAAVGPWLRQAPALDAAAPSTLRAPRAPLAWPWWLTTLIGLFVLLSLALALLSDWTALVVAVNLAAAGIVVGAAGLFALKAQVKLTLRLAVGLLGVAFVGYFVYVLLAVVAGLQTTGQALGQSTAGDAAVWAHFIGEGFAVLWVFAVFWAVGPLAPPGEGRTPWSWRRLAVAVVPGLLIAITPLFETWMQGVLARMSIGFTLFLPTPVYALAAVAYVYALLTCWDRRAAVQLRIPWLRELGAGLVLLPVTGLDLLTNYQLTMAALTLLLLTGLLRPLSTPLVALAEVSPPQAISSKQPSEISR
jgi:hypothetical protein